jgi:signal transduction histidine kinase/CheY-like chemotaxis protein
VPLASFGEPFVRRRVKRVGCCGRQSGTGEAGEGVRNAPPYNVIQPEHREPQQLLAGAGLPPSELARLAQELGTARELTHVFRALRVYIEAVTGNNAVFVSLLDSAQQWRRCVYAWADGAEVDVGALPALPVGGATTPHARAVATGEVVIVTDLQAAMAEAPNVPLGYERDPRPANVSIAVPLAIFGRIIGGFEVQLIEHTDPSSCVAALQVAANLAAAAIENLRLIETERELRLAAEASEQRYRSSGEQLRLALEAAGLVTWEYDIGVGELTWSQGTERVLGRPADEHPRTWTELLDLAYAEDRPGAAAALEVAIRTSGTRELEFRVQDATDRMRWIACRVHTMVDAEGRPARVFGVMLDVTAKNEAERQREALARSAQLRAIGEMASGIAHDLNQSLALISGYGELARDALAAPSPAVAEIDNMMDVAVRAAQDGARTLRQLLAFARVHEAEPAETLDLAALLREVAELTAPRWHAARDIGRGVHLEVDVPADGQLLIQGSRSALREALTNLIFNAVDALAEGGTIRLRGASAGDRVLAEVSDTGPGIPPELQARIFEPFFTTKGEHGTGLGLAQVSGVVARHGGELTVESTPGQGATFRLLLPHAAPSTAHHIPEGHAVRGDSRARRVLAVDDEPKLRNMVALMLRPEGHHVTQAASAEDALVVMEREGPFDLLLSDISMGPGMSGWELADRVRERWPGTAVVLASGWGAQIDPEEARARGVVGVLWKPFRAVELRRLVASLAPGGEEGKGD